MHGDELSYMLLLDRYWQLEAMLPLRLEWGLQMVHVSLCKATHKPCQHCRISTSHRLHQVIKLLSSRCDKLDRGIAATSAVAVQ